MSARLYEFPDSPMAAPHEVACRCGRMVAAFGIVPAITLTGETICSRCAEDYKHTDPQVTILRLEQTCRILKSQVDTAMVELLRREAHWKTEWWFALTLGLGLGVMLMALINEVTGQ